MGATPAGAGHGSGLLDSENWLRPADARRVERLGPLSAQLSGMPTTVQQLEQASGPVEVVPRGSWVVEVPSMVLLGIRRPARVLCRRSVIGAAVTGEPAVYAEALLHLERLPYNLVDELGKEPHGIAATLRRCGVATDRELLWDAEVAAAGWMVQYGAVPAGRARVYRMLDVHGASIALIKEFVNQCLA